MKFTFIVTGSIFLQSYWVSNNVANKQMCGPNKPDILHIFNLQMPDLILPCAVAHDDYLSK